MKYEIKKGKKMKIGFIGFGNVSSTLASILKKEGHEIYTSSTNRSKKTKELINKIGAISLKDFNEVSKISEVVISANSPSKAIPIAKKYGKLSKNIFIDLNNISPDSTLEISNELGDKFLKGAIIGKINLNENFIFISGKNAEKISILRNSKLKIKILSESVSDASIIKTLRSIYTKGVSALLIETFKIAKEMNLEEELFETLELTEGELFKVKSLSRINNSILYSKRKYDELKDILEYLNKFNDLNEEKTDLILLKATLKAFKSIQD
ncbi:tartronate semialdehyde reductase [Methanobrevibacter curvatus]|uniref:Tartronate semialdehyde reductase n=2 Tax=Methanobrevibacter curvatus TaxID=49547 RepID=A0A166A4S2_9EURY|nr:tartronate semialdehyde reductase [Methanobrevibacter curvatus]